MPTLREYLTKNVSAIAARSKLGPKLRQLAQSALLPELGDRDLASLDEKAVIEWGEKRLAEPKKDGSPRSAASVEQELSALEDVLAHFRGSHAGRAAGGDAGKTRDSGGKQAAPTQGGGQKRVMRASQRGR